jgi:hypothetical protein
LAEEEGNEQSCLASHDHATSLTLDLFDTASSTKLKSLVDDAKVMKPQPAQETTE